MSLWGSRILLEAFPFPISHQRLHRNSSWESMKSYFKRGSYVATFASDHDLHSSGTCSNKNRRKFRSCSPLSVTRQTKTKQNVRPLHSHSEFPTLESNESVHPHNQSELSYQQEESQYQKERKKRIDLLNRHLALLHIDGVDLEKAAIRSFAGAEGYDPKYGKSAIRAYRAYVDPRCNESEQEPDGSQQGDHNESKSRKKIYKSRKNGQEQNTEYNLNVTAIRFAKQIDFLMKRHKSELVEWIRNTDTELVPRKRFPLILVLDNVRSAFNVGSIFRTADACGCCLVITTGITPHPNGSGAEKLAKSALGADHFVPSLYFTTAKEVIQFLRNNFPNVMLVGMETTQHSITYTDLQFPVANLNGSTIVDRCHDFVTKVGESSSLMTDYKTTAIMEYGTAVFLGNEVTGLDTELMPNLDAIAEIPMFGVKNSLNVAACAPIVLYEILRQWHVRSD